jgi:hypothetical protein
MISDKDGTRRWDEFLKELSTISSDKCSSHDI